MAAYDLSAPTFRHLVYKEYKAQRPATENELKIQINFSKEILKAFGIPVYEKEGYEADDLIGAIVEKLKKEKDIEIIIGSGDLDLLQLAENEKIKIYTLKKGVQETTIYDRESIKKRFGFEPEFLPDFKALKGDPSDNIPGVKGIGEKTAAELIKKFGSLENILEKAEKNPKELEKSGIKPKIIELLRLYKEQALFSKELASIRKDMPLEFLLPEKFQIRKESVIKIFQELGFKTLLGRLETNFQEKKEITEEKKLKNPAPGGRGSPNFVGRQKEKEALLMFWLLDSRRTNPTIKDLSDFYYPRKFPEIYETLLKELQKENLKEWFYNVELVLSEILRKMEQNGIMAGKKRLHELNKVYEQEFLLLQKNIWDLSGEEFNINSPKEVRRILFEKLKISAKGVKKTPAGEISTAFEELVKIKTAHPVVDKLIQSRETQKIKSGFLEPILNAVQKDDRVHPVFNQTATVTGRLSSEKPNLQNIPLKIREVFGAPIGFKFISFDYSQIELRILAIISGDNVLKEAFLKNSDIHRLTALKIFKIPEEKISETMRNQAKTVNFGIIYGMGVKSLSERLGISLEEARVFLDEYFLDFPKIKEYIETTKENARKNGYVSTLFGRKRFLPEINSEISRIGFEAERQAINSPIQGSAADFIKIAMVKIDKLMKQEGLEKDMRLILQIHDELLFEIKEELIPEIAPKIKKIMEDVYHSEIPIRADVKVGNNWAELSVFSF